VRSLFLTTTFALDDYSGLESSEKRDFTDTTELEVGMSGMRLVTEESQPGRKETGSTVSSSAPDDDMNAFSSNHLTGKSPPDSVGRKTVAPASPGLDRISITRQNHQQHSSKPPGLSGGGVPSPIVKGHSKNSSATSPLLTLTPNSSIDGNEWNSNRHSPATAEAPSLPFLGAKGMVDTADASSFGSFELPDNNDANDGLLGLEALSEQGETGPVRPFSASPPASRSGFPAGMDERARRGERPPLSQSAQAYEGSTGSYGGDRSVGDRSAGSGGYSNYVQNVSMESADSLRGFGAIARPEMRYSAAEFDPSRRRAFSTDNFQGASYAAASAAAYEHAQHVHIPQKFGSLPSLGAHIQQHRMQGPPENFDVQRPRHMRSVSQPMQNPYQPHVDPRVYAQPSYDSIGKQQTGLGRSASLSQTALPHSYDGAVSYGQKRSSLPAYSHANAGYGQLHALQRRDALDFHQGTTHEDMRMFGGPNMISPGQSPLQQQYATSHSRHASDAGSTMLSSSPISLGSGVVRGHLGSGAEDELAHPLIGEAIDVPSDHFGDGSHGQYMLGHSSSMPMMRPSGHGHSMSMDQVPSYMEAPAHLPTAGSGLPLPKVVYYVKFKRTQRNFVLGPRISRDLKIGTYVKVEADRGEDLGIVVGKVPADKYNFANRNQYTAGMGPPPGTGAADLKRIIRLATHDEVALLGMKREEEEELLGICRAKVRQRGLPMNVVDAEYQFDRHKLTFFFEAEGRVDFRELVRDLFSMYKTRIWMQQLDKNTSTSSPAIMAPQAANNLQMDYGTPIIAPASEFADSVIMNGIGGG